MRAGQHGFVMAEILKHGNQMICTNISARVTHTHTMLLFVHLARRLDTARRLERFYRRPFRRRRSCSGERPLT